MPTAVCKLAVPQLRTGRAFQDWQSFPKSEQDRFTKGTGQIQILDCCVNQAYMSTLPYSMQHAGAEARHHAASSCAYPAVVPWLFNIVVVVIAELGVLAVAARTLLRAWRPLDLAVPICAAFAPTMCVMVLRLIAALHCFCSFRRSFVFTLCFRPTRPGSSLWVLRLHNREACHRPT